MKKKYIRLFFALLGMSFLLEISSFAQKAVVVKDEAGNPIPGAIVTVGEAAKPVVANDKGEFVLKIEGKTPVLIEAEGFESQLIIVIQLAEPESIVMKRSLYDNGLKDAVNVPFGSFTKRAITGSVTSLNPDDILQYDMQGDFSGILRGRVPGMFGTTGIRGQASALVIVDGIPRDAADLNPEQIDQITVVKDLASGMLYGSQANNGIIYITTKHGKPLSKSMHFTVNTGVNNPISYPNFLNAPDYMTMYNQALDNDGLPHKYTDPLINLTRSGVDPIHFPDQEYYNSNFLRKMSSYYEAIGEASGGNDIAQYYLNVGWKSSNSFLKVGEGANEGTDRLSMRGNIDYRLTDDIKINYNGSVIFNMQTSPRYTTSGTNFWTLSSTLLPDIYPMLIPQDSIKDKALSGAATLVNGRNVLGGTSQYTTNMYGDLMLNGPSKFDQRLMQMNLGVNYDMNKITPGLKASVYLAFDLMSNFYTTQANAYAVYQPNYARTDTITPITSFTKNGNDSKVDVQSVGNSTFYRRTAVYGTLDYNRSFGDNNVTITAVGYRDQYTGENIYNPLKHIHFGIRGDYAYKNKYIAEVTGLLTGSVKLFGSEPWGFSEGVGLGWVLSEENFLKGSSLINYLKLRTNFAINRSDENLGTYNTDHDLFAQSGSYTYGLTLYSNNAYTIANGNNNMGFEKMMNYNIGFESRLLHYKLGLEASYFYYKNYDMLIARQNYLPAFFTGIPYENYGANQVQGTEVGLNYYGNAGPVAFRLGSNLTYSIPKALIADQLDYPESYRLLEGKPTDAIFGYVAQGLFKDDEDIATSPVQTFGAVKPGDIKYADLNGDKIITDADQMMIGNSKARVNYGLNLDLKYKNFELFALGTGTTGSSFYNNSSYYWVYGSRKYSDVVLNSWTPATAETATYPRLTTLSSSNNFRNSTYWLYKYNSFNVQTLQLTYTLPFKLGSVGDIKCYLRGSNLLMVSKVKDMVQMNVGSSPQVRTYALGVTVRL